jgi:hypothetical protein
MSFDVESHVVYNIANAAVRSYPFPHFYVHPVFPEGYYQALLAKLPALAVYKPISETGTVGKGAYSDRYITSIEDEFERGAGDFWETLRTWLSGPSFANLILHKFEAGIAQRYGANARLTTSTDVRLVRDFTNYSIPPHTDAPHKLASLLFYLPPDDSKAALGTSIFTHENPAFRCEGTAHHSFTGFRKVMSAPYLPNSLFAFLKTDSAFHGVERIDVDDVERDLMLYNIYVSKIASKHIEPGATYPRSAPVWPWQNVQ